MKNALIIKELINNFSKQEHSIKFANGIIESAIIDSKSKKVIGSHYAISHYWAGLLLYANMTNDQILHNKAKQVFIYLKNTHTGFVSVYDYHNDFNNFIWALMLQLNDVYFNNKLLNLDEVEQLKHWLYTVDDSKHSTINWMTMRGYVNMQRYKLFSKYKYKKKYKYCMKITRYAKNVDGFFDDRVPLGVSANPQYHIYTLALLVLFRYLDVDWISEIEFSQSVNVILNIMDPLGDINYIGRGTNQIFGWGPWLFIFDHIETTPNFLKSLTYFQSNIFDCIKNNDLLLDNTVHQNNFFWWDYHYSSVYQSHLFFWLVLQNVFNKLVMKKIINCKSVIQPITNFKIINTETTFINIFSGRKEYLNEMGPIVSNLWISNIGTIFKGPLGPYGGLFGNKTLSKSMILKNYMGPISEKIQNRYLILRNEFPKKIEIEQNNKTTTLTYQLKSNFYYFNFPFFDYKWAEKINVRVYFDNNLNELFFEQNSFGPYGEIFIYRTKTKKVLKTIQIVINEK